MGFDLGKTLTKQETKGQGIQLIGYWLKGKLKIPEDP
jgi:hypothetical protein